MSTSHLRIRKRRSRFVNFKQSSPKYNINKNFEKNSPLCVRLQSKTLFELLRGLLVLKLCTFETLVKNNDFIMKRARQLLGRRLFKAVMKATMYGHFVAGESQDEV